MQTFGMHGDCRAQQEAMLIEAFRRIDDASRQIIADLVMSLQEDETKRIDNVLPFRR